jgi:flagellar basal-body rod modification protein FlgD
MDLTGVTSGASTGSQSGTDVSKVTLAKNFDTFLTLLTTELQNQDPLDPLDSKEFTNQLVSFTEVEQSIATNKNLEQLIEIMGNGGAGDLVNFLGKTVTMADDQATLADGTASWDYSLQSNSAATQLIILDANDRVVRVDTGALSAGNHAYQWDGTDSSGLPLPAGTYRLAVSAKDGNDSQITTSVTTSGVVGSVESVDGESLLTVGGVKVPISDILSVGLGNNI